MNEQNNFSFDVHDVFQMLGNNLDQMRAGKPSEIPEQIDLRGGVQDLKENFVFSNSLINRDSR